MIIHGITASQLDTAADFTAEAVVFDGTNDYLAATGAAGFTDGKEFTFSSWMYFTAVDGTTRRMLTFLDDPITKQFFSIHGFSTSNNIFRVLARNSSNVDILLADTDGDSGGWFPTAGQWYHMLISADMANSKYHMYVDDVDETVTPTTQTNANIEFTGTKCGIGDYHDGTGGNIKQELAEFYFTNEYIDITVEANRRKFISATGTPVYLGSGGGIPTGTDALIYYKGTASTWNAGTNAGTGGNFTMNGAVTDSTNEPVELP